MACCSWTQADQPPVVLQGLVSGVFGLLVLSSRICISVFLTQRSKSGHVAETDTDPARQPKLVCSTAAILNSRVMHAALVPLLQALGLLLQFSWALQQHTHLLQVALIPVCAVLLIIRGATGCVAIYIPYEYYWIQDRLFYPLDTLPEFCVLCILVWPCLMAQIAQAWPHPKQDDNNGKKSQKQKGKDPEQGRGM